MGKLLSTRFLWRVAQVALVILQRLDHCYCCAGYCSARRLRALLASWWKGLNAKNVPSWNSRRVQRAAAAVWRMCWLALRVCAQASGFVPCRVRSQDRYGQRRTANSSASKNLKSGTPARQLTCRGRGILFPQAVVWGRTKLTADIDARVINLSSSAALEVAH